MAALIGGQAVIMHGVPRNTIDTDAILYFRQNKVQHSAIIEKFADFLKAYLADQYEFRFIRLSKDPSDPLKHSLIQILDKKNKALRFDLLFANFQWEVDGLSEMPSSNFGYFKALPKPYLIGMKLMAGGSLDHDDIRNLLFLMSKNEVSKAFEVASSIKKNKILKKLYNEVFESH